jgi:hypothetical protein
MDGSKSKKSRNAKKRSRDASPKRKAESSAKKGGSKAKAKAVEPCPKRLALAEKYAEIVESSQPWQWDDIKPGLTRTERKKIRELAREQDLVPEVPLDKKQDYVDPAPDAPFVVFPKKYTKAELDLPEDQWLDSDRSQFKYLDELVKKANPNYDIDTRSFKGSGKRYTWHHAQDPKGRMILVEFGVHNATNHSGGRNVWGGGTEYR